MEALAGALRRPTRKVTYTKPTIGTLKAIAAQRRGGDNRGAEPTARDLDEPAIIGTVFMFS